MQKQQNILPRAYEHQEIAEIDVINICNFSSVLLVLIQSYVLYPKVRRVVGHSCDVDHECLISYTCHSGMFIRTVFWY